MPLAAVAIAVIADVGVGAAVVAGSAISTFAVVAAVGATVSAIGAVTGNKALTYAGLALGVVGGVGALASSAGLLSGSSLADTTAGATDATDAGVTAADALPGEAAAAGDTSAIAGTTTPDIIDSLGSVNPVTDVPSTALGAAAGGAEGTTGLSGAANLTAPSELGGSIADTNPTNLSAITDGTTNTASTLPPPGGQTPDGSVAPTVSSPASTANDAVPLAPSIQSTSVAPISGNAATPAAPSAPTSLLGKFFDSKVGPPAAYGVIQAAGSFLSGAASTLTPAQVDALNAQAAQNRAAAGITAQQSANIGAPIPTATRTGQSNVSPMGIINQPPPGSTITGQAA